MVVYVLGVVGLSTTLGFLAALWEVFFRATLLIYFVGSRFGMPILALVNP